MSNTLIVDIKKSKTRWPYLRPQQWYWIVRSAGNNQPLARSVEMFTNRQDCVDSATIVNGSDSYVTLKQPYIPEDLLRTPDTELHETPDQETVKKWIEPKKQTPTDKGN